MSYDDDVPVHWSAYDRVATAADDLKFLFEMHSTKESLQRLLGPNNYHRAFEYLDCVQKNLEKMGRTALLFATALMQSSDDPVAKRVLGRVQSRIGEDDINGAWNHFEAWFGGREITDDDDVEPTGEEKT